MNNDDLISNYNCIGKHLNHWGKNIIYFMLESFHYFQTALKVIISKFSSDKSRGSPSCPSSDSYTSSFKVLKNNKVRFRKINLLLQASEELSCTEYDSKNRTKSSIIERSVCLEVNKTEILSDSGE